MSKGNSGIIVSDYGTINAGALAAGKKARAINLQPAMGEQTLADVRQRLDQLVEQIHDHAAELDDSDAAVAAAVLARHEAGKDQPNPKKLTDRLTTVSEMVTGVAGLGAAVSAIVKIIAAFAGG